LQVITLRVSHDRGIDEAQIQIPRWKAHALWRALQTPAIGCPTIRA
jgi:hypothetical protein